MDTVTLPPGPERFDEDGVASGRFPSVSAVVAAGVGLAATPSNDRWLRRSPPGRHFVPSQVEQVDVQVDLSVLDLTGEEDPHTALKSGAACPFSPAFSNGDFHSGSC